ncbi:MAG: lecithin retinol acyltransferase family protein [Clostridia bacterium]|nr:lecithin retinol acyltransferase family protein [Clostridia bacterium]
MKWKLIDPVYGDMIRVKSGSIWHYGIYVSDEQVVQFGLAPRQRARVSDAQVVVCQSTMDEFCDGSFVEVAVPEKRDKKRTPPAQTVQNALDRLGEGGYNIVHNNCEHFAYQCYLGQKYCSQTDDIRKQFAFLSEVKVYYAAVPSTPFALDLPTALRNEEIASCQNADVKRDKYFVWKLLLRAIGSNYGKDATFVKQPTGKWTCNLCSFSLSHGDGVVAVSVSKADTGVDVERVALPSNVKVMERVFSQKEVTDYHQLQTDEQKALYFTQKWTQKESTFKMLNQSSFLASKPSEYTQHVVSKAIDVNGTSYVVSVACNPLQRVSFCKIDL